MDKKPQRGSKKYKISFLILLILMVVTFRVISKEFNFNEIIEQIINSPHKIYLLFAALMVLLYMIFYGRFSRIAITAFGEKTSRFKCFIYGCADFFYSAITPSASGGQPVVIYFMTKDNISLSTSTITVILQTICYKIVLLLYNLLSIIFIKDIIKSVNTTFQILIVIGLVINLVAILLCLTSMYRTNITGICGRAVIRFLAKIRIFRNKEAKLEAFETSLNEYKEAAKYIKNNKKKLLRMLFIIFLQRTALFSICYFVYKSFGLSEFNVIQFMCIQALVSLAVDSIPLPGGIGANEFAIYLLYGYIYGTDKTLTAAAMLLTRGFNYYFALILSGIFALGKLVKMHFKSRKMLSN